RDRERLHQHEHAEDDRADGDVLHEPAAGPAWPAAPGSNGGLSLLGHLRTAPKVMPRNRCFRSNTVKTTIGIRNKVVPAPTAGQSMPPSPMMVGMKGGAGWALPDVSRYDLVPDTDRGLHRVAAEASVAWHHLR